jgi:DNA-binding transcriptional ArsR family regulator
LAKRGPDLIDPRLAKALEHPIRVEILSVLREGPSSPTRIARRLENVSLNLVSHHMKVLKELGCIELVETTRKRGAKEHIYRATGTPIVSAEEWDELSPQMQQSLTVTFLRMISDDLAKSLGAGLFNEDPDHHLSRSPLMLDSEGKAEIAKLLSRTLDEVLEIGLKSVKRIETSDETATPMTVAIMHFPTVANDE